MWSFENVLNYLCGYFDQYFIQSLKLYQWHFLLKVITGTIMGNEKGLMSVATKVALQVSTFPLFFVLQLTVIAELNDPVNPSLSHGCNPYFFLPYDSCNMCNTIARSKIVIFKFSSIYLLPCNWFCFYLIYL